jgi:hypothetical protein
MQTGRCLKVVDTLRWRESRNKILANPWELIDLDLTLLALNDREAIGSVLYFLQNPPPLATYEARFAQVARVAFQELARLDYPPAIGIVRGFRGRGYVPDSVLDVYIAQFGRDVGSLEKLARGSDTAIAALNALARIEATKSLKKIARDRSHPYQSEAKSLLKERGTTTKSSRS